MSNVVLYKEPESWIRYDPIRLVSSLVEAKAAVLSLQTMPYQRSWVESLQRMELKREVAGTSKIEGAEFTERELEDAMRETREQLLTRSQKQVSAALETYEWIATLPDDMPLNDELIKKIHFHIVSGADDDHCPPGVLRQREENVTFGSPRHRGVEGGEECERVSAKFGSVLQREFREHDPLIQALAAHYHFAAMHPFLDGNGRTARALEALMLQRAGLRDTCFIAMSNYYYDEKSNYLQALNEVREQNHDLTSFLVFGLRGVAVQSRRLLAEIKHENTKALFRNMMHDLFARLKSPRKRVIVDRQIKILNVLLDSDWMDVNDLIDKTWSMYISLKSGGKALRRDLAGLLQLGALQARQVDGHVELAVRLEWPTEITETEFFERVRRLPKAKTYPFLR